MTSRSEKFRTYCENSENGELLKDEVFLSKFNGILHDQNLRISVETLSNWREGARIPNSYLAYLASLFGIWRNEYDDFQDAFSLDDYLAEKKSKLISALQDPKGYEAGYFADLFNTISDILIEDKDSFARSMGIYPSVLEAYREGSALPSPELIENIMSTIGLSARVVEIAQMRVKMDLTRLASEPRKKKVALALGEVTYDTNLNGLVSNILSERGLFPLHDMHEEIDGFSKNVTAKVSNGELDGENELFFDSTIAHVATGFAKKGTAAYQIFEDVGKKNKPSPSGDQIIKKFVESGGNNLGDLVDLIQKEQGIRSLVELANRSGIQKETLDSWRRKDVSFIMPEIFEKLRTYLDPKTEEGKLDLRAIAYGNVQLGDHFKIIQDARDLIEGKKIDKDSEENNIVYKHIFEHKLVKKPEEINGDIVSRALFLLLSDRYGTTANQLVYTARIKKNLANAFLRGEEKIGYSQGKVNEIPRVKIVAKLASFFSESRESAQNLAMLFFGFNRPLSNEELTAKVASLEMTHGQMLQRMRIQRLQNTEEFVEGSDITSGVYYQWEIGKTAKDEATPAKFCDFLGIGKDDKNRGVLIDSLNGKAPSISRKDFEKIVNSEYKNRTPDSFKKLVSALAELTGRKTAPSLAKIIKYDNGRSERNHISEAIVRTWNKGQYASSKGLAGAIADACGYESDGEEIRTRIMEIALNIVRAYDPSALGSLTADSPAEDKSNAYKTLLKNAGLNQNELYEKLYKGRGQGFSQKFLRDAMTSLYQRGTTGIDDPVKRREFLSLVANELVFGQEKEDLEAHRTKFFEVFGKEKEQSLATEKLENTKNLDPVNQK